MKAVAIRIGQSGKERIEVDGTVYLKSVPVGKWNYISRIEVDRGADIFTFYARHRTEANAWAYTPSNMFYDFWAGRSDKMSQDGLAAIEAGTGKWVKLRGGFKVYRVPMPYRCDFVTVRRAAS